MHIYVHLYVSETHQAIDHEGGGIGNKERGCRMKGNVIAYIFNNHA